MSSVCLPVRPSVTLVDCDHIGWNSSKIISRLVSLGCSLSADPNIRGLLIRKHPEISAQTDPPHLLIWASETFDHKLRPNGYRKPPSLFRMVPPTTSTSPKMGFHKPPRYANCHISATGDPLHYMFGSMVGFSGSRIEWPYLRNGSFDPLIYRASRGHLCDSIAFLSRHWRM